MVGRVTAGVVALVLLLIVIIYVVRRADVSQQTSDEAFASCHGCGGNGQKPPKLRTGVDLRRGQWEGSRGPYGLTLYDNAHYYPYYESRDYLNAWDRNGRCAAYCSASEDGGCAVVCR